MSRLPPPKTCSVALVAAIVRERATGVNARFFEGLEQEWRLRVEQYIALCGNPEIVPAWPDIGLHSTHFLTLYNSPGEDSVQAPILNGLRERKLRYCPACGEEGTPNTLDHYLPKRDWPHFAVTPANLTPMCDICQGKKGTDVLDAEGRRIFLHPYYDEFLTGQVLKLTIHGPFSAPEAFDLGPDPELDEGLQALILRHIRGLELETRYAPFFLDEYMRLLHLATDARQAGLDIRTDIPRFNRLHQLRSANVWPHLFYAAVSENQDLIDYLAVGDLPPLR